MALSGSSGSKYYIGPTTAAADASAYAALAWVEVKDVETIAEFGDAAAGVTFNRLNGRAAKFKGVEDAGDIVITCGRNPTDPGQIAVAAARRSRFSYAQKIVLEDGADENDTDSVFYFHAKVMSAKTNVGGVNDVTKTPINLAIDTEVFEVPSVAVS